MGRPTANPNTHGQPPLPPPQFNQQPPPQFHHQEQVNAATDPHEALQTSDHVPPPYTDHHDHDSSSSDDEDQAKLEMVPYDHLSPSEPPQPQMAPPPTPDQAYPQNPPPQQQVYHQNPPPQQAYLPNPPPQKTQPYPPQQDAFQGAYPPQGKPQAYPLPQPQPQPQPQAYPPPHNAQGPVQFLPPQPQGPVQFPPPQPQGPVQVPPPMNNSQATHTPQHHMDGMPPSPYKANVSQGVPVPVRGTNPWSSDLFACMDDPESAILTAFCPCMTFGQIAEIVDNGQTSCATSGSLYGVVALALIPCLVASPYRLKLRNRYNLVESPLPDWLAHWLFPWCALCQEYRELQHRGFDPSIGWIGNVARAQMQQQQAGMTPPANQAMTGL